MKYAEESGRHQTAPTSCDYSGGANFDANSAFRDYLTKSYVIPKPSKLNGTSVSQASGCLSMPRNAPDPRNTTSYRSGLLTSFLLTYLKIPSPCRTPSYRKRPK